MAVHFTKTLVLILIICEISTTKANLGYSMVKKRQDISSVRPLTHDKLGVITNKTSLNQKHWLTMKQVLAQLNKKQMNPETYLSHLIGLRDAIKTKKDQQELQNKSGKNGATLNLTSNAEKNQSTIVKKILHLELSDTINGSKVFPKGINIPNVNSQQLNIYLKFLDRIIMNKRNILNKVTNISILNMTTESTTVDEIAEKLEILKFISRNNVNATIQSTNLDEESEKVAILKLISGNQKTAKADLSKVSFGDLVKQNNTELSDNLKEQTIAYQKNTEELNKTTIQTHQNDGNGMLNQNTSQGNEVSLMKMNISDKIITPETTTVEHFSLPGNLSQLESHVNDKIMSDEELATRKRQKNEPHRHPTERDLSKHSLDKELPALNKVNGRYREREGREREGRDREGRFSKYGNNINQMQMYTDDRDRDGVELEDAIDAIADPIIGTVGRVMKEAGELQKAPEKEDDDDGIPLIDTLILLMVCIITTQCCLLALLYILKDKLIMNLAFKYGQIKV
ncbi:hypothetical protein WDU94_008477 [Cyamophila willieti]